MPFRLFEPGVIVRDGRLLVIRRSRFVVAPRTLEESELAIEGMRSVLAAHHDFAPEIRQEVTQQ